MLIGDAAAFFWNHLHDADRSAGISFAFVEQRLLVSLSDDHQIVEAVLAGILFKQLGRGVEFCHLLGRSVVLHELRVLQVAARQRVAERRPNGV